DGLATAGYLALKLRRPLFLEGEAGVGKTAFAQALAEATGAHLVRLQCYEGLDAAQALYDWDFPRQILHLRAVTAAQDHPDPATPGRSTAPHRWPPPAPARSTRRPPPPPSAPCSSTGRTSTGSRPPDWTFRDRDAGRVRAHVAPRRGGGHSRPGTGNARRRRS